MSFGTGSFSIAIWMKNNAGGRILINGSSGGGLSGKRYVIYITGSRIAFDIDNNVTKQWLLSPVIADITDGWHHIVCYRNGGEGKTHIHYDGEHIANTGSTFFGDIDSPGEDLYIACSSPDEGLGSNFPGQLDDIRFYDYVLSQSEIDSLASWENFPYSWNPTPEDGVAVDSTSGITLSWSAGVGAVSHDVYFGTSESSVTNTNRLAGDINGDGPVDTDDLAILSDQWLGIPVEPYADLDGDSDVDLVDYSIFAADWYQQGLAEFKGNQTATSYNAGILPVDQTYYWRVDEVNGADPKSPWKGRIWNFTATEPIVKIMPLGDSITQGGTHYRYNLWHKLADNGYNNINFVGSHDVLVGDTYDSQLYDKDHEGHAGWTTDDVLYGGGRPEGGTGNINIWLAGLQATDEIPDIVLMHLGTNDINAGHSASGTIGEMKDVIDILRSYNPNVTVLVAQVIPCFIPSSPGMDGLNALILSLDTYETATSDVIIVDHNTGFLQAWLQADLIHPNATGATEMSNRWYAVLVSLL